MVLTLPLTGRVALANFLIFKKKKKKNFNVDNFLSLY